MKIIGKIVDLTSILGDCNFAQINVILQTFKKFLPLTKRHAVFKFLHVRSKCSGLLSCETIPICSITLFFPGTIKLHHEGCGTDSSFERSRRLNRRERPSCN